MWFFLYQDTDGGVHLEVNERDHTTWLLLDHTTWLLLGKVNLPLYDEQGNELPQE